MRTLHVAALPFPSPQGTQALVDAMLCALHDAGHDASLLTYGFGAEAAPAPYPHERAQLFVADRSLRSGPSFAKLAHDAALALALRRCEHRLRPHVVVAHHVEAASLALLVCAAPVVYVAHTSLAAELPSYGLPRISAHAGAAWERTLCRRAARTLAVSPLLARMLSEQSGVSVRALTLPWSVPAPLARPERESARAELGLDDGELTLLYAGNLDGYQGLDVLARGLARLRTRGVRFVLLVATSSQAHGFAHGLARAGLTDRVRFVALGGEGTRRALHAAADLVLVPRACPGGIPIKLLDALARGAPVAAAQRALAGLPLSEVCYEVRDDDPEDWARAIERVAGLPVNERLARALRAREHIARLHAPASFVASFSEVLCGLLPNQGARP